MATDTALRAFLFADLRDYTAFVEQEGDRAAAELIRDYRALIRSRLAAYDGAELKTEGDSFYIVFPSPSKAIAFGADVFRTALEANGRRLKFGVGIHVGETVPLEGQFVGSAVNIAARVGAMAGEGELLVTDTVRGLVRTAALFTFEDRGPVALKGVTEPIRLFAVDWAPRAATPPAPAAIVAPPVGRMFVGRAVELAQLGRAAAALPAGEGRIALVGGAAGLGKTRLLREWSAASGVAMLVGGCGATDARLPYEPFTAMLRQLTRSPAEEARFRRVAPELLAFLPEVAGERPRQVDRDALFGAMLRLIRDLARGGPLAVAVEDLHWADDGTLALVRFLSGVAATTPFLLVGTYRDDELPRGHPLRPLLAELGRRPEVLELRLRPLAPADAQQLLAHARRSAPLADDERTRIVGLAEGNPLFLEELARSAGDAAEALPLTIAESVVRRVSSLDEDARRLVTYAAIVGQQADFELLGRVLDRPEREVLRSARAAIEASVLVEAADGLAFVHALTREAVYRDLMRRERRLLHREVAEALVALHGEEASSAAAIERQLTDAGLSERALPYALAAGQEALRLLAPGEAVAHFERAIDASPAGSLDRARALEGLGRAYRLNLEVSKAVATLREAVALYRTTGSPADLVGGQAALARALPFGAEERGAWLEAWRASEGHASPGELATIAVTLADRAHEFMDDRDAARWAERAKELAARSGSAARVAATEERLLGVSHPRGWHLELERGLAKRLDQALDRDENVLTAYRRFLDSRSREADAEERQALLARARAYAFAHGLAALPRTLTFRYGPPWMLWLDGRWDELAWLWSELERQFSGEDVWEIFPDTGPLAAAVRYEREGPGPAGLGLEHAATRRERSGTWTARVSAEATRATGALAEGRAAELGARLRTISAARTPQALELPQFLLAARAAGAAALLAGDASGLGPWLAAEADTRDDGLMFAAALDHLRAVAETIAGDAAAARGRLARSATTYAAHGWEHLAAELAWQRARLGDASGLPDAIAFYRARAAGWRVRWLEEERWR